MTPASATRSPVVLAAPLAPRPDQAQQWLAHSTPVSLDVAIERIAHAMHVDGTRADVVADLKAYAFGSTDGRTTMVTPAVGGHGAPLALRKHALQQLSQQVKVPLSYLLTLPAKLQILCMNWALSQQTESRPALLRLAGGEVRAIVSDRYAAVDDAVLMELVDGALRKVGFRDDAMVRSTVVGPHTVLRITIPSEGVEVKKGDVIEWGLDIGNSELGLRSVSVTPVTYRLICTNGMRAATADSTTRYRHTGDATRIRESLAAVIPTAFAEAKGDMAKWRKSVDVMIASAFDELESLRGFGLDAGEVRAVGRRLAGLPETTTTDELSKALLGRPTNAFDMANAITETARDRNDVAARLSLEETGHAYLTRRAS